MKPHQEMNVDRPHAGTLTFASLLSMNGLRSPASDICLERSCSVITRASAIRAECETSTEWFSRDDWTELENKNATRCSKLSNTVCVTLSDYNFTSGISEECRQNSNVKNNDTDPWQGACPPGDFAILLGSWSVIPFAGMPADSSEASEGIEALFQFGITQHQVDCRVLHGTVEIKQTGDSPPQLDRASFTKSESSFLRFKGEPERLLSYDGEPEWFWQRMFVTPRGDAAANPYVFAGGKTEPLSTFLLYTNESAGKTDKTNDSTSLARAIEANFDMANLLAFVRAPDASLLEITTTQEIDIWIYDKRVMLILVLPLLAAILVSCKCWRVKGNNVVIGYDPLEIAHRAKDILANCSERSEARSQRLELSNGPYRAIEARPLSPDAGSCVHSH